MEQAERERIVAQVAVHLREGTVPMTDSTMQNPVAGYIDRAHTRLERERVSASQPSVIAFGAQLRNAGDFVTPTSMSTRCPTLPSSMCCFPTRSSSGRATIWSAGGCTRWPTTLNGGDCYRR